MLRWAARFIGLLVLLVIGYIAYASYAWQDISAANLEQRYGDESLATAAVDGLDMRYRLQGQALGSAPVITLIHSHFLDMGMWDAWVAELAADFTVLRYDMAGHGLTGPDASGIYTVQRDVQLLRGLLDHLGIANSHVVGSSLGGNVAFHFAAQHPEKIDHLVLVNSGGLKRKSSRSGADIPAWADWVFPLVPPAALHRFINWMAADKSVTDDELKTRFVDMLRRQGNRSAELSRLRQFEVGDSSPVLAKIKAPTLVLWGQDNPQLPAELAQEFADKLIRARRLQVISYPGAGHLLPLERPTASVRDTRNFVQAQLAPKS
ncbi:MAG: alpha/beta fold hydrolase [Oceanococcus sp.]